jgi:hypothetical protein
LTIFQSGHNSSLRLNEKKDSKLPAKWYFCRSVKYSCNLLVGDGSVFVLESSLTLASVSWLSM